MEKLAALCCLWLSGLGDKDSYFEELDRLFIENPEDDLLLELEGLSGDPAGTLARFAPLINEENADKFGRVLFAKLEHYYSENITDYSALERFSRRTYELWSTLLILLPFDIAHSEPFLTLCYADDLLYNRGDAWIHELYQKAFNYY